jgi:hypothetical protein
MRRHRLGLHSIGVPGQVAFFQVVRVHTRHEHILVVAPVEDGDLAFAWETLLGAPQEVLLQLLAGRLPKVVYPEAPRVDSEQHLPDGRVLAGGIHGLKDQEHRVRRIRKLPLELVYGIDV